MKIAILSAVPWEFSRHRAQHIATGLAERGFRILFFQNIIHINPSELMLNYKEGNIFVVKKIMKNLYAVNLFLPDLRGKMKFVAEMFGLLLFRLYNRLLDFEPDAAIFYAPQYRFLLTTLKSKNTKIVYDCVDDFSAFTDLAPSRSDIEGAEESITKASSFVIATSKPLCDRISRITSKCIYLPNACDFSHFNKALRKQRKPKDIENLKPPIIGFIGAVSDWIDIDLICALAQRHPDYSILLAGPIDFGYDKLINYPNIVCVGTKKYKDLPKYLFFIDVCLIPFKINKLTLASNPIKLYEYLAAGKPVVSTALPEVYNNAAEIVAVAEDHDDFIEKVEKAVREKKHEDPSMVTRRIEFAQANSWETRVDVVEKLLRNT